MALNRRHRINLRLFLQKIQLVEESISFMFSFRSAQYICYPLDEFWSKFDFSTAHRIDRKRALFNYFMSNLVNFSDLSQFFRVSLSIKFQANKLASHVSNCCTSPSELFLVLRLSSKSQDFNNLTNFESLRSILYDRASKMIAVDCEIGFSLFLVVGSESDLEHGRLILCDDINDLAAQDVVNVI